MQDSIFQSIVRGIEQTFPRFFAVNSAVADQTRERTGGTSFHQRRSSSVRAIFLAASLFSLLTLPAASA